VASALFGGHSADPSPALRVHQALVAEALEHVDMLPRDLRAGLIRYVSQGVTPGHFLCAVLDNDLTEAVGRADSPQRLTELTSVIGWLFNYAPPPCYGSKAKRLAWEKSAREANGG
jgi:hypothetical protein